MPADIMRKIYEESGHDFSADICPNITIDDLDENAIEEFRKRWIRKTNNQRISSLPIKQLLNDCGALDEDDVTYAALVLFGKKKTLNKYLAQSEIIYEYRVTEASGPADYREDFRDAFFNIFDKLWNTINLRNTNQHYQEGFFVYDIPTFNETSIREAILNAVSHRNYQMAGSIFILQYNDRFVISNPGGFPPGITSENAINKQLPRNRRIAEILAKCGLVERSGQGMNLMFENSIKEAKALPCFDGSDDYELKLTLNGLILDKDLVIFFNKLDVDVLKKLTTQDFLMLNCLSRNLIIPKELCDRQKDLVDLGILEKIGRGKYILSRQYYSVTGKSGLYTRKIGLDRDTNKELLLKHIKSQDNGSKLSDLLQVLPDLSRSQVKRLLNEMKNDGIIQHKGKTSASQWHYCKSEVEK
jgi:ATP-dependent DNA helicase RecG